ncbi:MAG: hypothetical protein M3507_04150 [Actinomycetota bacterium]|nr:hypothetical protein [Actinomycetota bacterium]
MSPPTGLPRLLAIMGSGETSPTMVTTHRRLVERLGPPPVPAVVLDTPFGFQANVEVLAQRAVQYFGESVGLEVEVARWRSADQGATLDAERALSRLRAARYVFAGPGSPSYALRHWTGSPVPAALGDKLEHGGCVTFASAAALTLGAATVPVYEIYKAGEEPRWLKGLDLLARAGLPGVALIPHYDNAEGGNHDTRYCYLGEFRLALMEEQLPEKAFVLGVDEHTGLVLDLDAGTASVVGRGGVTVRRQGHSTTIPSGSEMTIAELHQAGTSGRKGRSTPEAAPTHPDAGDDVGATAPPSLVATYRLLEERFTRAVDERDVDAAVAAILELEGAIVSWSSDSLQSDEADQARAALRAMILRLGELAQVGARDPEEVLGPFIEAVVEARAAARERKDWAGADALRDRLIDAGVEISDTPEGTDWSLLT